MLGSLLVSVGFVAALSSVVAWYYSLLACLPVLFGLLLAPNVFTFLLIVWRRCPGCDQRNWSYPFTEGFGL
jgi:hypothetical protein